MAQILKEDTSVIVHVGPFLSSADAVVPNSAFVLSTGDETGVLKADTSVAAVNISGRTWSAVVSADGWYSLSLLSSDVDTPGPLTVVINDDSAVLPVFARFQVVEEAIYDALFAASAAGFDAAGQVTVGAISASAITSAAVSNDAVSKIVASVSAAALSALTQYDPPTDTEMIARTITSAAYVTSAEALARSLPSGSMVTSGQVFAQTLETSAYATSTQAVAAKTLAASAITSAVISASAIVQAHFSPDAIASAAISNDAVSKIVASVSAAALSAVTAYDGPTDAEMIARTIPSATYATSTQAVAAKTLAASSITSAAISNDAVSKIVASVSAAALSALTSYDPPTDAEMDARTLLASAYVTSGQVFARTLATSAYATSAQALSGVDVIKIAGDTDAATKLKAHALETLPVTFKAGGTVSSAVLDQVDGAGTSGTDDVYIGRILIFNNSTLNHQVAEITDYIAATSTVVISTVTTGAGTGHTARMV